MRIRTHLILVNFICGLLFFPVPALSQATQQDTQLPITESIEKTPEQIEREKKKARAEAARQKVICKKQKKPGTRIGKNKVCMKKWQWDQRKREAKRTVDDIVTDAYRPN